ncbi:MAG: hypothetical protein QNK63_09790 [Flavobacteriales bacterium]
MDNEFTYDPEDLERLLKEKSFSELLPEEKAFVLQFVENDLEYDSMRETLESLIAVPSMEEAISPKAATKEALMAAFSAKTVENQKEEREEKTGFWAWLWNTNKTILYRPGFQLASLALVLVSVFYIATFSPIDRTAQVIKKEPSPKESTANESKKEERKITLESVTEEEEEVKAIDLITEPITLVSEKDIEESTLDLNEAPELDQLEGILLDGSKFEIEDKKIEREANEIEQIKENNTKFNYQETESYTEIIITDVILENINADKTTLIYDARETTGNMASTPLNKTEVSSTMFSKSRNSLAASDVSLSDISINIPIKASKYSSLLSKLYTAQ